MTRVAVVENGKTRWTLASPTPEQPQVALALAELQTYIERLSGCRPPIAPLDSASTPTTPATPAGPRILVGLRDTLPDEARTLLPPAAEGHDGYALAIRPAVAANEPPRIVLAGDNGRGVVYAAYELLERLGCRWFYPTQFPDDPEVVPRRATLELDPDARSVASPIRFRLFNGCAWFFDIDPDAATAQMNWAMKNRYNAIAWQSTHARPILDQYKDLEAAGIFAAMDQRDMLLHGPAHSFDYFLPSAAHFEAHPEWFGMRDGKRCPQNYAGAQFCWSNAEARRVFVENVVAFARQTPTLKMLCIVPFDGGKACACPECGKIGTSNTLMILMREVIEAVEAVRPDMLVETVGGYHPMTEPPTDVELHPRQRIAWAHWGRYHGHGYDDPAYGNIQNLETWRKAARGGITLCQYYTDNFAEPWILPPFAIAIESDRRYILKNKIDSVYMLTWPKGYWWNHSFNGYLAGRCFYDVSTDPYAVVRDYAHHYFGPAAGPFLADYYEEWAREVDLAYRVKDDSRDSDRDRIARQRRECIDPAVAAAAADPVYAHRVAKVAGLHGLAERLIDLHRRRDAIRDHRVAGRFDEAKAALREAAPFVEYTLSYMQELAERGEGLVDRSEVESVFTGGKIKGWFESEAKAVEERRRETDTAPPPSDVPLVPEGAAVQDESAN